MLLVQVVFSQEKKKRKIFLIRSSFMMGFFITLDGIDQVTLPHWTPTSIFIKPRKLSSWFLSFLLVLRALDSKTLPVACTESYYKANGKHSQGIKIILMLHLPVTWLSLTVGTWHSVCVSNRKSLIAAFY